MDFPLKFSGTGRDQAFQALHPQIPNSFQGVEQYCPSLVLHQERTSLYHRSIVILCIWYASVSTLTLKSIIVLVA